MNIPILTLTSVLLFSISALGEEPQLPVRPPGVQEAQWVPISDVLGIIITADPKPLTVRDPKTGEQRKLTSQSPLPVRGILAIRRDGTWHRLELEPNSARVFDLIPK